MAYPSVHYGNFGDEKVTSTAKINGLPLGIEMVLPDGRKAVHARIGGTTAVGADRFADGWLITANSSGAGGQGYQYKIKTNNSSASGSTTCTLTLYETDGL